MSLQTTRTLLVLRLIVREYLDKLIIELGPLFREDLTLFVNIESAMMTRQRKSIHLIIWAKTKPHCITRRNWGIRKGEEKIWLVVYSTCACFAQ